MFALLHPHVSDSQQWDFPSLTLADQVSDNAFDEAVLRAAYSFMDLTEILHESSSHAKPPSFPSSNPFLNIFPFKAFQGGSPGKRHLSLLCDGLADRSCLLELKTTTEGSVSTNNFIVLYKLCFSCCHIAFYWERRKTNCLKC